MKHVVTLLSILITASAFSQQVQNFSLPNVLDGKNISLSDYSSANAVVIVFTVNSCAFDDYYMDRIKALAQQYQSKVPFLLVNSDADAGESPDNMIKRAQQLSLTLPYLADKDQSLMQSLNAHKSAETFLLKNSNGKFTVAYRGAIDDNPQVATDVKRFYLKEAVDRCLAGQAIDAPEVRPVGCNIRKK